MPLTAKLIVGRDSNPDKKENANRQVLALGKKPGLLVGRLHAEDRLKLKVTRIKE